GHCALALCHHWRDTGGRRLTSSVLKGLTGTSIALRRSRWLFSTTAELTIRGGGKPYSNMALMPTDRMDPPPGASPPMRMTASWSGSNDPTVYKFVARRCPQWRAPLGSSTDRHRSYAKAPVAVHHRSACSGVKALPNTSHAKAASRQALLAFRSLDPFRALREPDRRRRDEERPSRSEQRTLSKTKTTPLTGKAPYKFESSF